MSARRDHPFLVPFYGLLMATIGAHGGWLNGGGYVAAVAAAAVVLGLLALGFGLGRLRR